MNKIVLKLEFPYGTFICTIFRFFDRLVCQLTVNFTPKFSSTLYTGIYLFGYNICLIYLVSGGLWLMKNS